MWEEGAGRGKASFLGVCCVLALSESQVHCNQPQQPLLQGGLQWWERRLEEFHERSRAWTGQSGWEPSAAPSHRVMLPYKSGLN